MCVCVCVCVRAGVCVCVRVFGRGLQTGYVINQPRSRSVQLIPE